MMPGVLKMVPGRVLRENLIASIELVILEFGWNCDWVDYGKELLLDGEAAT
jgi:hypothetical protein